LKGVIEKKNQFTKRTKWSNKKSKDQIEKKLKKNRNEEWNWKQIKILHKRAKNKNRNKNNKDTIGKNIYYKFRLDDEFEDK
jgi:hypothetical protein